MTDLPIHRVDPLQQLADLQRQEAASSSEGGFEEALGDALQKVDDLQKQSEVEVQRILSEDVNDVHTAMIALQKADLSFQMMMQVRNKLVEAYQEIMRMQV